jgi:octanoyl-[GcvH]:protein N-octanoyltransferase
MAILGPMPAELHVADATLHDDPLLDTAISRALLHRVAAGELPETLRLYHPPRLVSFGRLDLLEPGVEAAAQAARDAGFAAVQRVGGGRAAVFDEGTIAFAHAIPDPDPPAGMRERFARAAGAIATALREVGVDARVGEVPGEYCPGEFSVNAEGRLKLAGTAQRMVRGGAYVEGVVVVEHAALVRDVLVPVYDALGFPWDPVTAGAAADLSPEATWDGVRANLLDALAAGREVVPASIDDATLELAREWAPRHVVRARGRATGRA